MPSAPCCWPRRCRGCLGRVIGALADRVNTLRLMIGCDLGQAAIYGLIAFTLPSLAPLLLMVLVASLLTGGTSASRGAILPALVDHDRLLGANVLLGAGFNLQVVIGPLVGALLFAAGGAGLALAANAGTFLVSAALLAVVKTQREPRVAEGGLLSDVREALAFVRREPTVRMLIISITLALAFLGIDNVALVFLVRDTLEGGAADYGLRIRRVRRRDAGRLPRDGPVEPALARAGVPARADTLRVRDHAHRVRAGDPRGGGAPGDRGSRQLARQRRERHDHPAPHSRPRCSGGSSACSGRWPTWEPGSRRRWAARCST